MQIYLAALALALLAVMPAGAQDAAPPALQRTPEGRPDFHGVWTTQFRPLTFERVEGATALIVTDEEAKVLVAKLFAKAEENPLPDPGTELATVFALPRVRGEWRSSMLVSPADGVAPQTEESKSVAAKLKAQFDGMPDNPEARDWAERCLAATGGAPFGVWPTENIRKIVQTSDSLVIHTEDSGETRIVGIGAAARPAAITSFLGDSTATWDGDVLVVTTRNLRAEQPGRYGLPGLMVSAGGVVSERFSLIGPDELLYEFTVVDPVYYAQPWSAEYSLTRKDLTLYEHACHEANYSLVNVLRIARNRDGKPAPKR